MSGKTSKTDPPELNFEQAITRLEETVDAMESGKLPLAELLQKFEEGVKLSERCADLLDAAELKVKKISMDKKGGIALEETDLGEELE